KLASSAVVGLKFDSDEGLPDASGVLIAADQPGVHAKAFTFSSKKWPHIKDRIGQGALIRVSFGRFGDDSLAREEEDTLVDYALDDLLTITGFDARAAGVSEIYTQRWFGGLPRFDEHHLATVATVRDEITAQPGLDLTGDNTKAQAVSTCGSSLGLCVSWLKPRASLCGRRRWRRSPHRRGRVLAGVQSFESLLPRQAAALSRYLPSTWNPYTKHPQ